MNKPLKEENELDKPKKSIKPSKWTSKEKKHCRITWTETVKETDEEKEKKIEHSLPPKEWCKLITQGLPIFKNKFGRVVIHSEFAYKEYMSGKTFEESIEKVKTYANNVRNSYVEQIKKFRLETFIKICEQHYNDNQLEITVEELRTYQFTDLEIDEYTNHMSENGVLDIIEIDGVKQYILKQLDAIGDETGMMNDENLEDKIEDIEEETPKDSTESDEK